MKAHICITYIFFCSFILSFFTRTFLFLPFDVYITCIYMIQHNIHECVCLMGVENKLLTTTTEHTHTHSHKMQNFP